MCELPRTSNHHYFDGNNKGPLYPSDRNVLPILKDRRQARGKRHQLLHAAGDRQNIIEGFRLAGLE
jgi:hypothetical protein